MNDLQTALQTAVHTRFKALLRPGIAQRLFEERTSVLGKWADTPRENQAVWLAVAEPEADACAADLASDVVEVFVELAVNELGPRAHEPELIQLLVEAVVGGERSFGAQVRAIANAYA